MKSPSKRPGGGSTGGGKGSPYKAGSNSVLMSRSEMGDLEKMTKDLKKEKF